jgi:diguanylate cyclase
MVRVLTCVFEQHNLWLVVLAAVICICACAGVFYVLEGLANRTVLRGRARWLFLAGVLSGGGTWATHFVAMLGYNAGLPVGYDLGWTLLSAAVGIVGAWLAFEIFNRVVSQAGRVIAGGLLGTSIVALHYFGMAGIEAAARQVWAPDLVVASLLLCAGFAIAALNAFYALPARYRLVAGGGLLLLGIVSLHFTAMGAVTFVADPRLAMPTQALDPNMLAVTVASGAAAVLFMGIVVTLTDRRVAATELAAAKHAARLALHDPLTGLPNRRHLHETLNNFLAEGRSFALVAMDLDRFKPINDLYGHAVGDELLIKIARLLQEEVGEGGFVARIGGDEFVLALPFRSEETLLAHLTAVLTHFDQPLRLARHEASVGATLGVAIAPADGQDADLLLRRADVALYRAKNDGRGRFAFFEPGMDARAQERAALEYALRTAVRNDEILPHFQPLVHLRDGSITGYEVLARWPHPTLGLVTPDQFIPIAVEVGLISELTFNILRRACRESLNWPGAPGISLNIAPVQLQDPSLPQKLLKILAECGFPPGRLEIEITEDALVSDLESARALLTSLKNVGVKISLDDFGTGYSSLRHLRELPFDHLKIDRSFVTNMSDSEEALSIVRTIVQLAKNLGLGVTAEGIESAEQAAELHALGCERGQGFHLGKPALTPVAAVDKPSRIAAA